MILGLDLGSSFGYALITDGGDIVDSGAWKFVNRKGRKTKPDDHPGKRFLDAQTRLNNYFNDFENNDGLVIAYEIVHGHKGNATNGGRGGSSGVAAAHLWGAWQGLLLSVCAANNLPVTGYHVGTVKKTAGHGNMSKQGMIDAAKERWEQVPESEDEADALWVAETHRLRLGGAA